MTIYQKGNSKLSSFKIYNPLLTKKQRERFEKMKIKVEKAIKLEDGKYEGIIKALNYRDKPFEYVDIVIEETKSELPINCGVPQKITENTMLGRIMENFGCDIEKFVDSEIDIEDYIKIGMKVQFLIQNKKTDKGTFSNIVPNTLKPLK